MKRKSALLCLGIIITAVSFGQKKPVKFVPPVIVKDTVIENVQEVTPPPPPPPPPAPPKKIHLKHKVKPAKIVVPPKPPAPPAKPKKEMKEAI